MKPIKFLAVKIDQAFSPAPGQIGSSKVYVKKENGICPQVGVSRWENESWSEVGIFYPNDLVYVTKVPFNMMKEYIWSP